LLFIPGPATSCHGCIKKKWRRQSLSGLGHAVKCVVNVNVFTSLGRNVTGVIAIIMYPCLAFMPALRLDMGVIIDHS
jgi:hypothetical protein